MTRQMEMVSKRKWTKAAREAVVNKFPELATKAESVVLATWALELDPDATPESIRELSAETGIRIAGRALGTARKILGLPPTRAHGRRWLSDAGSSDLGEIVEGLRKLELERHESQRVLRKMRDLLDELLD